jgi:hypothetical protein
MDATCMLLFRAALVVVALLLASVATASAECAWVLWLERDNRWGTVKAFGGLTECERGGYICVPSTIDLRGPKGGGR